MTREPSRASTGLGAASWSWDCSPRSCWHSLLRPCSCSRYSSRLQRVCVARRAVPPTFTISAWNPTAHSSGSGPTSSALSSPATATACCCCPRSMHIGPGRSRSTWVPCHSCWLRCVRVSGQASMVAWMTTIAVLSFWASLGEFAGPAPGRARDRPPSAARARFYGLLATLVPGLRLFRFPCKLLVFTAVAMSALAGIGWDRVASGVGRRRVVAVTLVLLGLDRAELDDRSGTARPARREDGRGARIDPAAFSGRSTPGGGRRAVQGLAHGAAALALEPDRGRLVRPPARRGRLVALPLLAVDLAVGQCPPGHRDPPGRVRTRARGRPCHPGRRARRPESGPVPHSPPFVMGPHRLVRGRVDSSAAGVCLRGRSIPFSHGFGLLHGVKLRLDGREPDRVQPTIGVSSGRRFGWSASDDAVTLSG